MKKYGFLLSLFLLVGIHERCVAQLNFEYTEGKILLKGKITDLQTHSSLPNASIVIKARKKGLVADEDGNFQIYVYPSDTLRFSSLNYIYKDVEVAEIPDSMRYSLNITLMRDFYKLKEVTIYPYASKREFEEAFVKGSGVPKNILVPGIDAPTYKHKEKAKFYNPISTIYNRIKSKRSVADPNFEP